MTIMTWKAITQRTETCV